MTEKKTQIKISAQPQNAAVARDHVRQAALRLGFSKPALDDIEIAVGEAVTNAILYGSPTAASDVTVLCEFHPSNDMFIIEIHDQGHGFDPGHVREDEDNDALGGRGLRLMRALMDELILHYDGAGMVVRLSKKRGSPQPAP